MGDINWAPAFVLAIIALVIFGIAGPLVRKKDDQIGKDNKTSTTKGTANKWRETREALG